MENLFIHVLDENRSSLSDIVNDEINFHKYKNDAIANYQVIELTPTVVNNIRTYKIVDTYTDPDIFRNVKTMDEPIFKDEVISCSSSTSSIFFFFDMVKPLFSLCTLVLLLPCS